MFAKLSLRQCSKQLKPIMRATQSIQQQTRNTMIFSIPPIPNCGPPPKNYLTIDLDKLIVSKDILKKIKNAEVKKTKLNVILKDVGITSATILLVPIGIKCYMEYMTFIYNFC